MHARRVAAQARRDATVLWQTRLRPRKTFSFDGQVWPYLWHPANATWRNERAVEVPIALRAVSFTALSARVLEVGNVLTQYARTLPANYTVVDKYEDGPGLVRADVLDIDGTFDLIVSVSTIEHVGLDETSRDWTKARAAIHHLVSLLAPGGLLLVTWPLGYNRDLDDALRDRELGEDNAGYLRRVTTSNLWVEASAEEAFACWYGYPWACASAITVVSWRAAMPAGERTDLPAAGPV